MQHTNPPYSKQADVILIGTGIMSATLGVLLKHFAPSIKIDIYERLDSMAAESTNAWNNAGTGHSAFCELNYTPIAEDGSIDIKKAISILEQFEVSKQFWSYLIEQKIISNPQDFIRKIPHISFVWGANNVNFLEKRYDALSGVYPFAEMRFSKNPEILQQWMPLVMQGRTSDEPIAATKVDFGTDVNFGALSNALLQYLDAQPGVQIFLNHEVEDINKETDGTWCLDMLDKNNNQEIDVFAKFVFIGAGGGSLHLLKKSNIPEGDGYGGFPVSGQWLRCINKDVIAKHDAKVYGKASVGAPPMSVPHLDTRVINGEKALLFGPYAGFNTKFLKNGSYLDLPTSISFDNIMPMVQAGLDNIPLTKYLLHEITQDKTEKLETLKQYLPTAQLQDWEIEVAGQRVQVIKKDANGQGVLEFGTEMVVAADGSLAALLGASPGASTAVSVMLKLIAKCFPDQMQSTAWQQKAIDLIPSFGKKLSEDKALCDAVRLRTHKLLQLI
jgi:malate dehydrogenase (quinone)